MNNTHFESSIGSYQLKRLPELANQPLRAWDAADEYLLQHLLDEQLLDGKKRILLINDDFGTLATCLHEHTLLHWSDSLLSQLATQQNLANNTLKPDINYIPSTEAPEGKIDLVLIKTPKTLALLEEQLIIMKPLLSKQTIIIGAGMVKYIHTSTLDLFEKVIGTTKTSLAQKKARLIFAEQDQSHTVKSKYPITFSAPEYDLTLSNHANVFAKQHLDIGARFMLEQFSKLPSGKRIVDLGCGNGVLGIVAQRAFPDSEITFLDESYMAIASAEANFHTHHPDKSANFLVSDVFSACNEKVDLILCNPPFHQQHAMGDHLAWLMFKQSYQHLPQGGELWVVANRHLAYHVKLKQLFGNCRTIGSNKKFVVLACKKPAKF
ncbi:MAG: 23S rRNA (guanine-N-2-) -methyltransferase rlmG (EC [uncultured Thiotrichaceae bacterium]|uniref:Ribosomal RNA large subunit methyltransferase G n=1 Tax=uncultured Thiotrichaceae bacterium TaxID=298394 RepID=A0A6S6SFJ7_9GAMM|nr:MAG: 23S rRNA (guanine-N-2-) -methyltransferase rlmG (EC [uncultured Thiotrichaceae bacterium]